MGRTFSQTRSRQPSVEGELVKLRHLPFISFSAPKTSTNRFFFAFLFFFALCRAAFILVRTRPALILSFGGYLTPPFAILSKLFRLPLIIHEQTHSLGKANQFSSRFAAKIALSFPLKTDDPHLKEKLTVTGNPLRHQLFTPLATPPSWFPFRRPTRPLLYISGGSQGAQRLNQAILPLLPQLSQKFIIIHQVGSATAHTDYVAEHLSWAQENQVNLDNYFVRSFLSEDELRFFYPRFSLAIARSGANTVAELSSFAIPALYIPLPQANYNEQYQNALFYKQRQAALILEQDKATPDLLERKIASLVHSQSTFKRRLIALAPNRSGAANLYQLIMDVLHG